MNTEKFNHVANAKGFIAALDQSGGSTPRALKAYGIEEDKYSNDTEMFDLIHEMRSRIIKSKAFTSKRILGAILFEKTMERKVEGKYTAEYLWEDKKITAFLKVDKGLKEEEDGVQLMKDIPNLEEMLQRALKHGVFGTKMRSVIKCANVEGIKKIVKQQFEIGKIIASHGLVPILEPEVSIKANDKAKCEEILKEEILKELGKLKDEKLMFKITLPEKANLYKEVIEHKNVVRVVALSGGYTREKANEMLAQNHGVVASFSRALVEGLNVHQSDSEFDKLLDESIESVYQASIK
ncbi:fructose bisphosphate aldolase [Gemelliphila asaccharolytica]|uniref:fructose-bisphosphate aldolase n=1 Tax=Gemelliphila asaccharolytica TaxID=502393 RepID=A0ABR5TNZ1_9BACL|nr:fructose bisphosphate aldolase [Gemella asaccharolytica]KXB56292.1 fructose-bisphosphate aldolase class-I [Gemella asaccharolytica]